MAAETGFMIDGTVYEVPSWDTFTMDEAQVLYDYCGLTIEDIAASEDEDENAANDEKMKNPGFTRALLHVAYQRGNPKLSRAKVTALVGSAQMLEALQPLIETLAAKADADEDDAGPPESTTEQEQPLLSGSVELNESSGSGSEKSSDGPAAPLALITTPGSGTLPTPSPKVESAV